MNLFRNAHESWIPLLHSLAYKEPMVKFLDSLSEKSIQPEMSKIFRVFEMPVKDIKMVILGQEPYPRPGTAIELAYATNSERQPEVLSIIKKELIDYYTSRVTFGGPKTSLMENIKPYQKFLQMQEEGWNKLEHWEQQGIFLLNTALTVETGGGSHALEWKEFTERVIAFISQDNPCIWMLWGTYAHAFGNYIINPLEVEKYDDELMKNIPIDPLLNYTISGLHPVTGEGFSKGGFKRVNELLEKRSLTKIIW
jgi:uracil-DNA glycosylase